MVLACDYLFFLGLRCSVSALLLAKISTAAVSGGGCVWFWRSPINSPDSQSCGVIKHGDRNRHLTDGFDQRIYFQALAWAFQRLALGKPLSAS